MLGDPRVIHLTFTATLHVDTVLLVLEMETLRCRGYTACLS